MAAFWLAYGARTTARTTPGQKQKTKGQMKPIKCDEL